MAKGRILVRGPRVQDIGYRLFLLNLASESNLTGFQARNIDADCVEALYEGGERETEEFAEKVKRLAPKEAEVSSIEFKEYEGAVKNIDVFRSEFTTMQLGKIVEIGLEMVGKQDATLSRQDKMLEKQDIMIEKMDDVGVKINSLGVKVDSLGVKIDDLREDLKSMLDRRLITLEKDVALIKSRLGIV